MTAVPVAYEVLRAVARAHLDVEPDEVMRGEVEGRAEALDLERPRELPRQAVGDARRARRRGTAGTRARPRGAEREADERLAPTAAPPDVGDRDRHEHGRIELHRHRRSEQRRSRAGRAGARARPAPPRRTPPGRGRSASARPSRAGAGTRRRAPARRPSAPSTPAARAASPRRAARSRRRRAPSATSKTSRKPCSSSLRSAGTTNAGSAPGGYSGLMSRYGTAPSSIALP